MSAAVTNAIHTHRYVKSNEHRSCACGQVEKRIHGQWLVLPMLTCQK